MHKHNLLKISLSVNQVNGWIVMLDLEETQQQNIVLWLVNWGRWILLTMY